MLPFSIMQTDSTNSSCMQQQNMYLLYFSYIYRCFHKSLLLLLNDVLMLLIGTDTTSKKRAKIWIGPRPFPLILILVSFHLNNKY